VVRVQRFNARVNHRRTGDIEPARVYRLPAPTNAAKECPSFIRLVRRRRYGDVVTTPARGARPEIP